MKKGLERDRGGGEGCEGLKGLVWCRGESTGLPRDRGGKGGSVLEPTVGDTTPLWL